MSSLQDLNTYSTNTITFTDNRPSGVVLSYPTARDVNRIITDKTIIDDEHLYLYLKIKSEKTI
jgi:hypothetical protein